jgi:hypothetical protein
MSASDSTSNLGLPIYSANDKAQWDDTNAPFQNLDNKVVLKDISNTLAERLILNKGENLNCENFDITNPPSINTWGDSSIRITDKNTNRLWFISPYYKTDGSVDLYINHDQTNNANGKVIINSLPIAGYTNVQSYGNFASGQYTMQHTGILCISGISSTADGIQIYKNGSSAGVSLHGNGAGHFTTVLLPVTEGDVISTRNGGATSQLLAPNMFSMFTLIY